MKKHMNRCVLSALLSAVMVFALCSPAMAYVSSSDTKYLSKSQQNKIAGYTSDYNSAKAAGNTAGMEAAHNAAQAVRATVGGDGGVDGSKAYTVGSGSSSGGYVAPTTYTITASAGTGGSISPSGSTSVTSGSSQTYTITANSGYKVLGVTVDGASQGAISTYTLSSVTSSHSISVTFASAASLSAGDVTLGDNASGTLKTGNVTKSGYGVTTSVPVSSEYVSDTMVTASYNFTGAQTQALEYVNGTWQFPVNSSSTTVARKIYIPVATANGTYTITFTVTALDPQATALTGSNVYLTSTKSVTLTINGSMYDDDFTGNN